jgi:hypothetical protein
VQAAVYNVSSPICGKTIDDAHRPGRDDTLDAIRLFINYWIAFSCRQRASAVHGLSTGTRALS